MKPETGFNGLVNSNNELGAGHKRRARKHQNPVNNTEERNMMKTESPVYLPPEVRSMVFSQALNLSPRCALDILVPEWNICRRQNPALEKMLEITRVVTYTKETESNKSTLSRNFGHDNQDHILLPMKMFDTRLATLDSWCFSEVSRDFYKGNTHVFRFNIHDFVDEWRRFSMSSPRRLFPLRGKAAQDILPFDDEIPTAKKMCPWMDAPIFTQIRHIAIHSPLSLLDIGSYKRSVPFLTSNDSLDAFKVLIGYDLSSSLRLSWSQMPQLESVLLDLRIYSHEINTKLQCLGQNNVIQRATEMGKHLNLKLLVIAGLQSSIFETSYESVTAKQVEQEDEIDSEPNWIKIFRPCLRPGGKIILIDRIIEEQPSLPFWSRSSTREDDVELPY